MRKTRFYTERYETHPLYPDIGGYKKRLRPWVKTVIVVTAVLVIAIII